MVFQPSWVIVSSVMQKLFSCWMRTVIFFDAGFGRRVYFSRTGLGGNFFQAETVVGNFFQNQTRVGSFVWKVTD